MTLNEAIAQGELTTASKLLRGGADPNAPDATGEHPLETAARAGNVEMTRILLESGANAKSKRHAAVVVAGQRGHAEVLGLLLAAGADPNQPDEEGCLALCQAATGGHLEAVRLLAEAGADPQAVDADENSPIRGAALRSRWDVVEFLMPLSAAADQKDARQRRGKFDRRMAEGQEVARSEDRLAAAMSTRPSIAGTAYASVRDAVAARDPVAVGKLLAAGADVNEADPKTGRTALMLAAEQGDLLLVRHLLAGGANIDAKDKKHAFALLLAARGGHLEVVKALADAGANAQTREFGGDSPILAAAKKNHWTVTEFLDSISSKDDGAAAKTLHRIAKQGAPIETARQFTDAARTGNRKTIERMLAGGLPVDVINGSGQTALMTAANHGQAGLVRMLLERGADPALTDTYDQTALDLATAPGDVTSFDILWPVTPPKRQKKAMKQVEFNRMLPNQFPAWKEYRPPVIQPESAGMKASRARSRKKTR